MATTIYDRANHIMGILDDAETPQDFARLADIIRSHMRLAEAEMKKRCASVAREMSGGGDLGYGIAKAILALE